MQLLAVGSTAVPVPLVAAAGCEAAAAGSDMAAAGRHAHVAQAALYRR